MTMADCHIHAFAVDISRLLQPSYCSINTIKALYNHWGWLSHLFLLLHTGPHGSRSWMSDKLCCLCLRVQQQTAWAKTVIDISTGPPNIGRPFLSPQQWYALCTTHTHKDTQCMPPTLRDLCRRKWWVTCFEILTRSSSTAEIQTTGHSIWLPILVSALAWLTIVQSTASYKGDQDRSVNGQPKIGYTNQVQRKWGKAIYRCLPKGK